MENMTLKSLYFPPLPLNFNFKAFFSVTFLMPEKIKAYNSMVTGEVRSNNF